MQFDRPPALPQSKRLRGKAVMLSEGYQDGFRDGWSDQRDGRKSTSLPTNDFYGREYRRGYDEGVRAYAQRIKGRFAGGSGASRKDVA